MKYYLIAGEASGDLHASNLMKAIAKEDEKAKFRFFGGKLMRDVGGECVKDYKEMAYMGFIPVLLNFKTILRNMNQCKTDITSWSPDVLILIDYPGFNLKIAEYIKNKSNIPIYYYISPKIWAWKEYRIKNIKRDIDKLFSILPFEIDFFKKHNYKIDYVGNPCVDAVNNFLAKKEIENDCFYVNNHLPQKPIIAILAGSRKQEIKDNLVMMLDAAITYTDKYQIIIAGAPSIDKVFYNKFIVKYGSKVNILFNQTYDILLHSKVALVTSGTATLETSLFKVPQVVCYYTPLGKIVSFLKRHILKVKYISLVNLIANKEVVKELVADKMNIENIKDELNLILNKKEYRENMLKDYDSIINILGKENASGKAAKGIIKSLSEK